MEDATGAFDEALELLKAAWDSAVENGGDRAALEAERDELAGRMSEMTRAEEIIRQKISEKQAEQEAKQAEMDEFAEIKERLEKICERLGIENAEIQAIKDKIEEECEAIGAENASLAEIIAAAEGKAAERDNLVAQKEELEIQQTELQSKVDAAQSENNRINKKMKKLIKKKKKLELALQILGSDSE